MEAAHAVCWEQSPSPSDALLALADLVDASLVQADMLGTETRYRMLEITHEYALARLRQADEEEPCRRRHALWFAELATNSSGLNSGLSSGQLVLDLPNVRSALAWAELNEEADIGMRLVGFAWALFMAGHIEEATLWMERMLDLDTRVQKKQRAAPPQLRVACLGGLARALLNQGRIEQAMARASESLRLAEQIQDPVGISNAYLTLGLIAQVTGRLDQAAHAFTESYIFAGRAGRRDLRTRALVQLGDLSRQRGDTARAESLFAEALTEVRAGGETWDEAIIVTLLGHLANQQQQYDIAEQRFHESLVLLRAFHNPTFIAWCLEGLAATLVATGYPTVAVRLCSAAAAQRAEAHTPLPEAEREQFERVVATARADLDEGPFDTAWAEGTALSLDDAVAEALKKR